MSERHAVYAGSFDPFTVGHLDIVRKASRIFDSVTVLIGKNSEKKRSFPAEDMRDAIEKVLAFEKLDNCKVVVDEGIVADYCKEHGISFVVRGLRNNMDYNYEENIAKIIELINPELECVYLRANNEAISSSMVKELLLYGKDISDFVPVVVKEKIREIREK